jgi:hypothetical protein
VNLNLSTIKNDVITACGFILVIATDTMQAASVLHLTASQVTTINVLIGVVTVVLSKLNPNPPTAAQEAKIVAKYRSQNG